MVSLQLREVTSPLIKKKSTPLCKVLLVESDYVNFLMSGEVLSRINVEYQRVNSFHEATLLDGSVSFDIVLISATELSAASHQAVTYLHKNFKSPIILLLNQQSEQKHLSNWYNLFDGVILNNADSQYFKEIILDILEVKDKSLPD